MTSSRALRSAGHVHVETVGLQLLLDLRDFNMDVVESVNVHDDIKIGLPTRDQLIENYKQTIRNLAPFGVKVICYNFMPVFDWTRTDLFHPVGDGSTALYYEASKSMRIPRRWRITSCLSPRSTT